MTTPAAGGVLEIIARPVSGGALARAALAGELSQWYPEPLRGRGAWRAAAEEVRREHGAGWAAALAPALALGGEARARLESADVVVTTGQQPGLFGGPLYTLYKALTALALADHLTEHTGLRVAPVFWAATDDSDYAEANHVAVVARGELRRLDAGPSRAPEGTAMAHVPLGEVGAPLATLAEACGSTASPDALDAVRRAYVAERTVGGAYVALLRDLLQPLGVAVLDAAHPVVRTAAAPTLRRALREAGALAGAVAERTAAIEQAGMTPQVTQVPELSLVFRFASGGARQRVRLAEAERVARDATPAELSPNVLLRPVVERQILPTVAYVAGPGEVAYFAQVSAVAAALGMAQPRVVPRWGGLVLDPAVRQSLEREHLAIDNLRDPHAAERLVARRTLDPAAREALTRIRETLRREAARLDAIVDGDEALRRSVGSMRATAEFRVERLERRLAAARKRGASPEIRDVRLAQAWLYPGGVPQERVLSFVPLMARYGAEFTRAVRAAAALHVAALTDDG